MFFSVKENYGRGSLRTEREREGVREMEREMVEEERRRKTEQMQKSQEEALSMSKRGGGRFTDIVYPGLHKTQRKMTPRIFHGK